MSLDVLVDRPLPSLIRHNLLLVLRDPAPLASYLVIPILLMSALQPIYAQALGNNGVAQLGAGQAVMFSLFALGVAAAHIFQERDRHTLDRLRAAPLSGWTILVGKLAPLYVVLMLQQILLLCYAIVVIGLDVGPRPVLVLAVVAAWSVTLLAGAALLGLVVGTSGQLNAAKDLGAMSLSLLGGALVPHALLPAFVQPVAVLSPAYWAISAYRAAFAGDVAGALLWSSVLLGIALCACALAAFRLRRGGLRPTR
jgi:ABC-2 type transport system permease protein